MVKKTHENILNAVLRLLSQGININDLTLTTIATEARISRQAIYNKHFSNVDEIFQEIKEGIDKSIYEDFELALIQQQETVDIYEIIANTLLPNIYAKRDWIRVMYYSSSNFLWKNYLKEKYVHLILKYYSNQLINHSKYFTDKQMLNIACDYIISVISEWLLDDIPLLPNQFKKEFLLLMNCSPCNMINIRAKV